MEFGTIGGIIGRAGGARKIRNGSFHPGITMHRIPAGAGFAGLIFTVGSLAIFLIGLPVLWYFLAGAIALGVGFATVLHFRKR
ncbi:MAG: hypothetical protein WCA92_02660 [Terriglobales bacterium]